MPQKIVLSAWVVATAMASGLAMAATELPQERVNLSSSASVQVPQDVLNVSFSITREGGDASAVQAELKSALDAALTEARKVAKPAALELQTGGFSLSPRYAPKTGQINGWQGQAQLLVHGTDTAAIAQLTGRVKTLVVQSVSYSLSPAAYEKVQGQVTAEAIARFRAKAAEVARLFGYGSYVLGEVAVDANEPSPRMPGVRLMAASAKMLDEVALPTEAGKTEVTVRVSGSIQLTKDAVKR